ncbi:MAG: ATP-binding protein [Opitutales bacterium]|nr:ATP-binding protein [Opitutales bacterium]
MIIDFSVRNFRSFREEQKVSFVASNYEKTLPQNLIDPQLSGRGYSDMRLLKVLVMYGANAAGKTNVLHALRYLVHMVENSATHLDEGDPTGAEPFRLDDDTQDQPSSFVLRFVVDGVRYHFTLVLNEERILFESIAAYPKGRKQLWYERKWDAVQHCYEWGPARPVDYKRDSSLFKYTRANALYLSTAVKFNDEQLKPLYLWFKDKVRMLSLNADFPPLSPLFTARTMMSDANRRAEIMRMLQHADFGILSARATERDIQRSDLPKDMPDVIAERILKEKHLEIELGHKGKDGKEYTLDWNEESSGTKKFFALAGPWLDILRKGFLAGLDEIESSMHPAMVDALLKLVQSERTNPLGAQLICTTHNPALLDGELMRRDQIWLVEKDEEGASHVYPLTKYKPRKKESLIRGYLTGRYGATPFIPGDLLNTPDPE